MNNIIAPGNTPAILITPGPINDDGDFPILVVSKMDLYVHVRDLIRDKFVDDKLQMDAIKSLDDAIHSETPLPESLPEGDKMDFDIDKWMENGKGADH